MASRHRKKRKIDMMESWIAKFIAIITIVTFYGYIAMVTFYPFENKLNMEFVNLAMGWIGGVATAVITFYFGSSSGSAEKTEMLNRAMNKMPNHGGPYMNESHGNCQCKAGRHDDKENPTPRSSSNT